MTLRLIYARQQNNNSFSHGYKPHGLVIVLGGNKLAETLLETRF